MSTFAIEGFAPEGPSDHGPELGRQEASNLARTKVLVVGVGGVGAPTLLALVEAGVRNIAIADDDLVELENLHRQILFSAADIGRSKLDATRDALVARAPDLALTLHPTRALPSTAAGLVAHADVVVDATDNFATRFLIADACGIAKVPVVHAAAIRWTATALAVAAEGAPCYRCLFEDIPDLPSPDCATAGIVGPVCGVAGALAADLAIRLGGRDASAAGRIVTYDGATDTLRAVEVPRRPDCALCGRTPTIHDLAETRYLGAPCAA